MPETPVQSGIASERPARIARELTIARARDLLDWFEAHGITDAVVEIDELDRVTILQRDEPLAP